MNKTGLLALVLSLWIPSLGATGLLSPNKNIKVVLEPQNEAQPQFQVYYSGGAKPIHVLRDSLLGLKTDAQDFSKLTLVSESPDAQVHDDYTMPHGKRKHCENTGIEKTFRFKNPSGNCIDIVFRAYDDGIAFRYMLTEYADTLHSVKEELTTFAVPEGVKRWAQPYTNGYEDFYPPATDGGQQKRWGFPALFNIGNDVFLLMTEADVSRANYGSALFSTGNGDSYQVNRVAEGDSRNQFTTPWQSPWRVLIIGPLSGIVESTLVTDVSSPCVLPDTSWIKPGPASWIYWAHNHGTKDYQLLVKYVDLAVDMGWPYTLIDWEWDQMGNGGNIEDIVKYANGKGIKPLMWYNSGTSWMGPSPNDRMNTDARRAQEFAWLKEIGVYGVKVDFFPGDQQKTMNHYISILEDAARYKLMVNFHGATLPRGWNRTYPNLMTVEGVYGAEWYNNNPTLTNKAAAHNATLPFTRNVVGSMDYTPVTFTDSQHKHVTSYAHELALSVVFESGIQHFADRPSGYRDLPAAPKNFLKTVPVAWDDTKLIDGYPGEKVVIARRKGDLWYIGGINGTDEAKTLAVTFGFLKNQTAQLVLIQDGADDKSFATRTGPVRKGQTIKLPCLPRGGFVGTLR